MTGKVVPARLVRIAVTEHDKVGEFFQVPSRGESRKGQQREAHLWWLRMERRKDVEAGKCWRKGRYAGHV